VEGDVMKRAALYLRRSTDRQDQSIEDQKRTSFKYAAENGYEIIEWYIDEALTGTTVVGRNDFQKMMGVALAPNPPFQHIIAYDIKRFSRGDNVETGYWLYKLREKGIQVLYATENFKGDDSDDLVRSVKQWLARQESKDLSKVTFRGLIRHASEGWWNGGVPPHGYDIEHVSDEGRGDAFQRVRFNPDGTKDLLDLGTGGTRRLESDDRASITKHDRGRLVLGSEDRWRVVIRIFDMYVNLGRGFRTIAELLNRERMSSPKGKRWTTGTIRSIIENPIYTGRIVYGRRASGKFHRIEGRRAVERDDLEFEKFVRCGKDDWIEAENAHPAIIDDATFEKAQAILKERSRKHGAAAFRSGRAKGSPYLLSGLIHCTRCGHKYHGRYVAKGKLRRDGSRPKTYYYACNSYINGRRAECPGSFFRRDPLESGVLARVKSRIDFILGNGGKERLKALIAKEFEADRPDIETETRDIEKRAKVIDMKIDTLLESLTPENKRFVDPKLVALGDERDVLQQRLRELKANREEEVDTGALADTIMAAVSGFDDLFPHGTIEEKKELIGLFVEKIELDSTTRVGKIYMKRFPVPTSGTGKSFGMVAGARYTHQKRIFPPVDVIDIQFEYQGKALVPVRS
jgi:DNA invertase Pin-like site-specific DNA recombinase